MGRNSTSPDHHSDEETTINSAGGGGGFSSIRDRFRFKRNPNHNSFNATLPRSNKSSKQARFNAHARSGVLRRIFQSKGRSWLYTWILIVLFAFALASLVLQSSIMSVFRQVGMGGGGGSNNERFKWREDFKVGSSLHFVPSSRKFYGEGLDRLRTQPRVGVRAPRIGLIIGNMKKDPLSLMLCTVMKNLKGLGYQLKIYATEDGKTRPIWEEIGGQVSILSAERYDYIDWSIFEGVIVDSLEAKDVISSLMQEPFCSVPLIWIIQEDTLANRLQMYEKMGQEHLISHWKRVFSRADVVVFPDYSLLMLYSLLDTGNFFVIPGSPINVWAAEKYSKIHSRSQLREEIGFQKEDLVVLVVGSSFFYNELSLHYAVEMHDIEPLLIKYAGATDVAGVFKFIFLCGNSSDGYNSALQDVVTRLGLRQGSIRHYGTNGDMNSLILMSDIILYGSSQGEQGFPSILTRAMSFGVPVVAPDSPNVKKYVVDGVHVMLFPRHDRDALMKAFSQLLTEGKLSKFAHSVASSARLLAKNMQAAECITGYAKLLENVFNFPSEVVLPGQSPKLMQGSWEWKYFQREIDHNSDMEGLSVQDTYQSTSSIIYALEHDVANFGPLTNVSGDQSVIAEEDIPTALDWDILDEMESSEEIERLETEEIEERMEKDIGDWDEIYRNARKSDKLKFEINERDEGELERTGQPVCIYEIYNGAGSWPFLHHGSLYRGLSLSSKSRRLRSDDVDAVGRLSVLNDTYYRDILCGIGGVFAMANGIDNIHKRPWIGFQSWHASGRKASLSTEAEQVLEKVIQEKTRGDVIYFWARLDLDGGLMGNYDVLTFWSMCDILNGGNCRTAFEHAFRRMYGLPSHVEALPPMPEDGGYWSALHSWVMPTPSFLEFVMFSRMFVDSLHGLHINSSQTSDCLLGVSTLEKKHCYCRVMELLVNVWAYHSARKMVYIDPRSGYLEEQHPIEQRKGFMWAKYFDINLLKSMDEDLAEAADDNDHPYEMWLWPLTGEVYWQGIYEREREERYRLKMDKKRKTREKLLERMKYGYRQKTLGG